MNFNIFQGSEKIVNLFFNLLFHFYTFRNEPTEHKSHQTPDTTAQELGGLGRNTPFAHILPHGTFHSSSGTASLIPEGIQAPLHHPKSVKRPHLKHSFHAH